MLFLLHTESPFSSQAGWGDDEADSQPLNPHYNASRYDHYSRTTRTSLALVDEARIDYDLLEQLLVHLHSSQDVGAFLVFLPGMGEISVLRDRLSANRILAGSGEWIIPLHSSVAPAAQWKAFAVPPAESGARKIVLATNIAETSLTIDDVTVVVDCGKLKERRHDAARGMRMLVEDWVSQASARQRKGRAGRVRAGVCFSLFTRHRFEERMRAHQAPEMMRVPLEELVLQIKTLGCGNTLLCGMSVGKPRQSSAVCM